MSRSPNRRRLRVDPIRCDGYGFCAELVPERIMLDDWGYPIVDQSPFGAALLPHAKRAVSNCPRLALLLEEAPPETAPGARPMPMRARSGPRPPRPLRNDPPRRR